MNCRLESGSKWTIIESNFKTLMKWVPVWTFIWPWITSQWEFSSFFLIRSLSNSSRAHFKRPLFDTSMNLNVNDLEHALGRGLSNFGTQWIQIPLYMQTIGNRVLMVRNNPKHVKINRDSWLRNKPISILQMKFAKFLKFYWPRKASRTCFDLNSSSRIWLDLCYPSLCCISLNAVLG